MGQAIGEEFVEKTKYKYLGPSAQARGVPPPPVELPYDPQLPLIKLPKPDDIRVPDLPLRTAVERRRSVREYSPTPLTTNELSFLLWCTQGVREPAGRTATFRTVPSAGARHALETYLLVNRVAGIVPGIYRYLAWKHALLAHLLLKDVKNRVTAGALGQTMVNESAVTFIWAAVVERMAWRYGQRGYRYLYLDAGHVCQNLYLAAETVACGTCAIAAFADDDLNDLLGFQQTEQFTIYMATVGKKPT